MNYGKRFYRRNDTDSRQPFLCRFLPVTPYHLLEYLNSGIEIQAKFTYNAIKRIFYVLTKILVMFV